jgi:hypothetical protein
LQEARQYWRKNTKRAFGQKYSSFLGVNKGQGKKWVSKRQGGKQKDKEREVKKVISQEKKERGTKKKRTNFFGGVEALSQG